MGKSIEILSMEWLFDHHTAYVQPLMTTSLTHWNYVLFSAAETIQIIPSIALQIWDMIYWLGEKVLHSICEAAREIGK